MENLYIARSCVNLLKHLRYYYTVLYSARDSPAERSNKVEHKILISPDEACERLGVGRSTMYRLLDRGEIASVRLGRLRRIPLEWLRDWVDKQVSAHEGAQGTRSDAEHTHVGEDST
jgi:excisionase family DNA binding protein